MKRAPRLRSIPPRPAPLAGGVGIEGAEVLAEVDGALGLTLLRALRDVRAWVETPREGRAELFPAPPPFVFERLDAACAEAPVLAPVLVTLSVERPFAPARRVEACLAVSEWAEERGLYLVALLFAEAAAWLEPLAPRRANRAGRLCRILARWERSKDWLQRAYALSVRTGDREEAILALAIHAHVMKDLGRLTEAKRFLRKAAAKLGGRRLAAEYQHDVVCLAIESGDFHGAFTSARETIDNYAVSHPRLPALAYDVAYLFLLHGYYEPAKELLDRVLPFVTVPGERAVITAAYARAASAMGLDELARELEATASDAVSAHPAYAGPIYVHLAEAMRHRGRFHESQYLARMARAAAVARQDRTVERIAVLLEKEAHARRAPISARNIPSGVWTSTRHLVFKLRKRSQRKSPPQPDRT